MTWGASHRSRQPSRTTFSSQACCRCSRPQTRRSTSITACSGIALSRFSGLWIGFKAVTDTIELTRTVDADLNRVRIVLPQDVEIPQGGLNSRRGDFYPLPMERRLVDFKLPAAKAFARANGLDRVVFDGERRALGIVTSGKAYLDAREALRELGIDEGRARALGVRLYKVGMVWPLETDSALAFGRGHQELLVLEEKRPIIEEQLTHAFYHEPADRRPRITGKTDDAGKPLKPAHGELSVNLAVEIIARRIEALGLADPALKQRIETLRGQRAKVVQLPTTNLIRPAYFCSGCPHNTTTRRFRRLARARRHRLPRPRRGRDGSQHDEFVPMGHEGSPWVAVGIVRRHAACVPKHGRWHVLALRHSRDSRGRRRQSQHDVQDAVQRRRRDDGRSAGRTADHADRHGESAALGRRAADRLVSDNPEQYARPRAAAKGHDRSIIAMSSIACRSELREVKGVTALVYEQTCAAEKRRRRKRRQMPNPTEARLHQPGRVRRLRRLLSAIELHQHPAARNRVRAQAQDRSVERATRTTAASKGFCPSFVTVDGGGPRKGEAANSGDELGAIFAGLPAPAVAPLADAYNILVAGIGGTGVLTIGAILGMAAHLDGKGCSVIDITGMAQKGGAVVTHLRFGASRDKLFATRLWENSADLVIGCDLVVTTSAATLDLVRGDSARIVVNSDVVPTAQFQSNQAIDLSQDRLLGVLAQRVPRERISTVPATSSAVNLIGDSIATNVFMLGFAIQEGLMPVALQAIEQAVNLNGVAIEQNLHALNWGRLAAHDPKRFAELLAQSAGNQAGEQPISQTLEELVARRVRHLTDYQDAAYARMYTEFVEKVRQIEAARVPGSTAITNAVAFSLSKLMSYKDEYEVARLYTNGDFLRRLTQQFDGNYKLNFHLSPPIFNPRDKARASPGK